MTADLGSLTLGSSTLDPSFDAAVTEYSTTTTEASDTLAITLAASSATAVVKLNGTEVEGDDGEYALTWGEDPNEVEITVTDSGYAGEVSKTYTIAVTAPVDEMSDADANADNSISRTELQAMTVAQLKQLAAVMNVTLTATRKADIIDELLGDADSIEIPSGEDDPPDPDVSGG